MANNLVQSTLPSLRRLADKPADRAVGKQWPRAALKHIVLIAAGLVMVFPLLWMVSSSFKPDSEIFGSVNLIPSELKWSNYSDGWNAQAFSFGRYMTNSLIVTLGVIIGNLFSCTLAAYGFTRLRWRGRGIAFGFMLMTLMLPIYVLVVPQYVMWSKLDLINTFVPLILPKFLATDPFFVFLMVQFFRGVPRQLDEAARVDGAGYFRIFLRIILPNVLPALATTAIFAFIWTWNDFFNQLLYLTKPENLTAAVALRNFADSTSGTSWGPLFAMSTLSLIPVFVVFLIGQRFLVTGVATTGLK
jgi:multiple sugar transport system permease protein